MTCSDENGPFRQRPSQVQRLLSIFYKLLYHQMAWTYDTVAWIVSLGRWKSWVYAALPYLEGPSVLELGHGPGHLQAELLGKVGLVAGLDQSRQMGRLAYLRLFVLGCVPLLVNGYAQFMPFKTASFHQVVATFPTVFITDPQTLAEVRRVLVPDGRLVILPFAWITGRSLLDRFAAWLFRVTEETPDAKLEYVAERFSTPIQRAGFRVKVEKLELQSSYLLLLLCTPT